MGTRSLTRFFDDNNKDLCAVVYRQFDGYPDGHGTELAEFLSSKRITNGIRPGEEGGTANGMGCLAAQMVKAFKEEVGNIYLTYDGDHCQDYTYDIHPDKGSVRIVCKDFNHEIFEGTPEQFIKKFKRKEKTA